MKNFLLHIIDKLPHFFKSLWVFKMLGKTVHDFLQYWSSILCTNSNLLTKYNNLDLCIFYIHITSKLSKPTTPQRPSSAPNWVNPHSRECTHPKFKSLSARAHERTSCYDEAFLARKIKAFAVGHAEGPNIPANRRRSFTFSRGSMAQKRNSCDDDDDAPSSSPLLAGRVRFFFRAHPLNQ